MEVGDIHSFSLLDSFYCCSRSSMIFAISFSFGINPIEFKFLFFFLFSVSINHRISLIAIIFSDIYLSSISYYPDAYGVIKCLNIILIWNIKLEFNYTK